MSKPTKDPSDVITEKEGGIGFDVDWATIEEVSDMARDEEVRRHSHSQHRHSSSSKHGNHKHHSSRSKFSKHTKKGKDYYRIHNKKKWSKKKKIFVGILLFLLALVIAIATTIFVMRLVGKNKFLKYENMKLNLPDYCEYDYGGAIVYYKGHVYEFNKNIATIFFMGIDNRKLKKKAKMGTAGQADALYLLTYDTRNDDIKLLCLNRDTMTDVSRFDSAGNYVDTKKTQLCLAYAFGDGQRTSAENQVQAVQRLIYNIPIYAYYGIDLSAISILNDDMGGVTLTPNYSFLKFKKGQTTTLHDGQAEAYVRYRDVKKVDDNLRRIECQKQYINEFAKQTVYATMRRWSIPGKLYADSSKYTVTNVKPADITYLATDMAFDYKGMTMINTKGKYKMKKGDASAEYFLNKRDFFETILNIYYTQIK